MIFILALAIQDPHHLIAHHQGNSQLRASALRRRDVVRIVQDVGRIDGTLLPRGRSGDALFEGEARTFLASVPANLAARIQFLFFFIQQQDCDILQMEIVACDDQDLAQDLVQIEGREHRLARIVEDGDFLHSADEF
jgi:hypothetical protein